MKIFVVTHKQTEILSNECYIPIVVGNHSVNYENGVHDNTGDNISDKNANYCELTALYWMWKNLEKDDYYGLCHYRRYFNNEFNNIKNTFSQEKAIKALKHNDVLLPFPFYWDKTVKNQLLEASISSANLEKLRSVIELLYPEYLSDYDSIMNGKHISCCNMFIMSKKNMDLYCEWLFNILFELEKNVDVSNENNYRKRIFGFLSERLLNVWIKHNDLRYDYMLMNDISYKNNSKAHMFAKMEAYINDAYKKNYPIKKFISKIILRLLKNS